MKATITTTITTTVDIESLTTTHEVDVATNDPLPQSVVMAAATGGCKSALKALQKKNRPPPTVNNKKE